jgi:UPF0042 nucleotide-binding protein
MIPVQLVLITGLSGSGKSSVAKCFEDLGFYCVDNLPLPMLRALLQDPRKYLEDHSRIAVVTDVRAPGFAKEFPSLVHDMESHDIQPILLFLEADEQTLVRRFSETRRAHPLAGNRHLLEGIRQEKDLMAQVRGAADRVFDTSRWTIHDARSHVFQDFASSSEDLQTPVVSVVSFGFKHGIPGGTDLLFDVRFLPNPYFIPELQPQSGKNAAVRQYLENQTDYEELLSHLQGFLQFALPKYREENRSYVSVAIGCTGGRHRSVAVAEELAKRLGEGDWSSKVLHRDIEL